jgi:hypothetical protein
MNKRLKILSVVAYAKGYNARVQLGEVEFTLILENFQCNGSIQFRGDTLEECLTSAEEELGIFRPENKPIEPIRIRIEYGDAMDVVNAVSSCGEALKKAGLPWDLYVENEEHDGYEIAILEPSKV